MGSTHAYLLLILIVNLFIAAEASYYTYAGNTFFDAWTFTNNYDKNNTGRVMWVDRPTAMANNLTSINSAGHAVIKMHTQQVVPNEKLGAPRVIRYLRFRESHHNGRAGGNPTTAAGRPTGSTKNSASRGCGHGSSEAWYITALVLGLL
ncbi:hypothetical protein JOM56_013528 [Amanita muscaria]